MNYQWLIGGQETQPWEYGINIHELKCSKQIFYSQLWLARPINFVMEHSKKFNTWEINLWGSAAGRKMFWRWIFLTLFYHYLDNVFRQKKSDSAWLLLLLSHFSHVQLCVTPWTTAHQAFPSMGFSRQEDWIGLPFPSPMHVSGKWKWSRSVVSDS